MRLRPEACIKINISGRPQGINDFVGEDRILAESGLRNLTMEDHLVKIS
jgi:hypothetical protein